MSEVMKQSTGGALVIDMDYMMKYDDTRAREHSREHYVKMRIVIHGALAKHKTNDNTLFKRVH